MTENNWIPAVAILVVFAIGYGVVYLIVRCLGRNIKEKLGITDSNG